MANEEHLAKLKEGVKAWNRWRKEHYPVLRQRCGLAFQQAWGTAAPAGRQGLQTIKEAGQKTFARLRTIPWLALAHRHWKLLLSIGVAILLSIALISVSLIVWKVPQWQAARWAGMEAKDLAKLENDARTALIQAISGVVLLLGFLTTAIGLILTWRNLQITQNTALKNLLLAQDKQITEQYTRAIEQLGSSQPEIRLGAIYALERIARDSEQDHWPIMEILTAYVRGHTPWEEEHIEELELFDRLPIEELKHRGVQPVTILATDIQAILTVLGRRTRSYGKGEDQPLDLSHTDLHEVDLRKANLVGADLSTTNLRTADLCAADLREANLCEAHLRYANLTRAQLQGADLRYANLMQAELRGADLRGANLMQAELGGLKLDSAEVNTAFRRTIAARGLTVEQLSTVYTLYGADLDPPLLAQIQQQYPHLLEEPQE